jgi:hypothetical protein
MDSCLNQKIPVQLPGWKQYSVAPKIQGYSEITGLTPGVKEFLNKSDLDKEGQLQADDYFARVVNFESPEECVIECVSKKKKKSYCKVAHILDPIRTIQGYYNCLDKEKGERRINNKILNSMNKAYIDSLACYLLGQLRERKISPHFCLHYGSFKAKADVYRFNMTDEYDSFRNYKAFWERKRNGIFSLYVNDEEVEKDDIDYLINTPKSSLRSTPLSYNTGDSDSESDSNSVKSHITLSDEINDKDGLEVELESVDDLDLKSVSDLESDNDSDYTEGSEIQVYVDLKDYPVMLIFQEKHEGVMDELLEEEKEDGWEEKWTAWMFQVIAALCCAQGVLGFTHNDLHTNNIVWEKTNEPYFYYKDRSGTMWRVPTYGKVFRIIDFGRSIYRVGEKWFISDDYEKGGDAEGQYNFDSLTSKLSGKKQNMSTIYPNPSFDLSRLSISIIDSLYETIPNEKEDGNVLSKEDEWIIKETDSELWNLLWSWLIDENGKNILRDEDGTERFPNFDLYIHIGKHVHNAKPQDQLKRDIFNKYKIDANSIGDWETVYPLFC